MESNLFRYILRHSRKEQIGILLIVVLSQVFYFLSLDLPRLIIDRAIQGQGFESADDTTRFLNVELPVPDFLSGPGQDGRWTLFEGFELERVPYLVALSLIFLLLVFINGLFKFVINTRKGQLGERMLRRLRYTLFDRVLRSPQSHLRKMKQAEIATMIKDEVEPLGGFIGDAFVQPVFLGGQALTALIFILVQSVWLGLITIAVLLLQAVIIPRLRVRILQLAKQRQLTARQLAGRVAEIVDGSAEIHIHDTSNLERADIAQRLGRIYRIRFDLYQWKFAVKFLNNLLAQVTPFLFYLVGGYLAITGRLEIGSLVAVIAAYKDLPGPVKELIDWDQQRQDVQIKYEQVIEQFSPSTLLPARLQDPNADAGEPLAGSVTVSNLSLTEEGVGKVLDGVSFAFDLTEHVGVVGPPGHGKEILALVLARLVEPTGGTVSIGGRNLVSLPEAVTGRRMSYAGQDPYLFPGSLRDNLLYGLKHRPLVAPDYDEETQRRQRAYAAEARRAGNPEFDFAADWIDYQAVEASGPEALDASLIETLHLVELNDDAYQFGLRGTIQPDREPDLAARLITARGDLRSRLADQSCTGLFEPFDRKRYNRNMSVAENILFGTPLGDRFDTEQIARNAYLRSVLERVGLIGDLLEMGRRIAETMVELFADLPPGHPFFEQFSFIGSDDLPDFRALLARIDKEGLGSLDTADRARLIGLSFPYVEARHRLALIDPVMEERILVARRAFARHLPDSLRDAVEFYDETRYNSAATLQDNILFGRVVYGQAQAQAHIGALIAEVVDAHDLRPAILRVGLGFQVGNGGKRLTPTQRQKLGLGRALVKRPDFLIVNEATAALDGAAQLRMADNILAACRGRGVLWVLHRDDLAEKFDRVLTLRHGRLFEDSRRETTGRLVAAGH
ncbi:ABC transporter ATP-binding protein/permease [Rhodospirillaceae bacterium SYSU D60014]|uniref:ABC transporter transmembrane domain-containing protein n=1 Tax=Virgifigura deserti TaxID=2268457 RepID=UPI000E663F8A